MNKKFYFSLAFIVIAALNSISANEGSIMIRIPNAFSITPTLSKQTAICSLALVMGCTGALMFKNGLEGICLTESIPEAIKADEKKIADFKKNRLIKNSILTASALGVTLASISLIIYSDRLH